MSPILAALTLLAAPAFAQDAPEESAASATSAEDDGGIGPNIRYRYLFVPRGIVNSWYQDTSLGQERPGVSAHVVGLELGIENRPASFLIYAEYWKMNWQEGYWDDKDDGAQNESDGDWLQPSKLGMVALGADFGHEFELSDSAQDVWAGFRMGGGLGLGIPTGKVNQWHPGADFSTEPTNNCAPSEPLAINRKDQCDPDEELEWPIPVLPLLDMDLGFRLHFAQTGILRLDFGLHTLPYVGVGAGAVF